MRARQHRPGLVAFVLILVVMIGCSSDEEIPPMTRIAIQITVDTIRSARSMFRNPQRGEAGSANAFGLPAMVTVFVVVRLTGNWQ